MRNLNDIYIKKRQAVKEKYSLPLLFYKKSVMVTALSPEPVPAGQGTM